MAYHHFLSCSNVQFLRWFQSPFPTFDLAAFNSLHGFLFNLSCLQDLEIFVPDGFGIDSLISFVFCGAPEHGLWRDIRSVKMAIVCDTISEASHLFDQTVGHQPRSEKWWKSFTVAQGYAANTIVTASM